MTDNKCVELKPATDQTLWSENIRLRRMLKSANDAAGLHQVMLREGNHRIKNSLQIVSSLLSLQAGRRENSAACDVLHAAASRIQAVASMHDALQAREGHDWIDLGTALEVMCRSLQDLGGVSSGIDIRVEGATIRTPVAFAQPLLLAVNELVLNALRHAFPDGRVGSVAVQLTSRNGEVRVVVADNGVGLRAGHPDEGFGMKLVEMMTRKINGALYINSGAGTRVTIVVAEPQPVPDAGTNSPAPLGIAIA